MFCLMSALLLLSSIGSRVNAGYPYTDCALIGNRANMEGAKLGHLIDSHDVVVRLNFPKLHGFDEDIGKTTDIVWTDDRRLGQYVSQYRNNQSSNGEYYPMSYKGIAVYVSSIDKTPHSWKTAGKSCTRFSNKFKLFWMCQKMPLSSYYVANGMATAIGISGHDPSTILIAIAHLMTICKQLTIYGFEPSHAALSYWMPASNILEPVLSSEHIQMNENLQKLFNQRLVFYQKYQSPVSEKFEASDTSLQLFSTNYITDFSKGVTPKGLNNQLWFLSGTVKEGCQMYSGNITNVVSVVILPRLSGDVAKFVGIDRAHSITHLFGDLFDIDALNTVIMKTRSCLVMDDRLFQGMVERKELTLLPGVHRIIGGSMWPLRQQNGPWLSLLYKGLSISQRLKPHMENCNSKLSAFFGHDEEYVTIHMRVEDDWVIACYPDVKRFPPKKVKRHGRSPFPCLQNAAAIAKQVARHDLLGQARNIFMIYAADRMNLKSNTKRLGWQPDPMTVWPQYIKLTHPQDLGCTEQQNLTYTERSVLNLFLAANSPGPFVGYPMSSFSMGAMLHRYESIAHSLYGSYFYGCASTKFSKAVRFQAFPHNNPTTKPITC